MLPRAYDIILHTDQLAFVVPLLALPRGYDSRTVCTIGRAIGLRTQHACMVSTRGHAGCILRGNALLEENLLSEVRDRGPDLALLRRVRTA